MVIYRRLLVSTNRGRIFTDPQSLLAAKLTPTLIIFDEVTRGTKGPGTHAALLRTCHRIYAEALPILYGENVFSFHRVPDIEAFRWAGLNRCSCKKHFLLHSSQ